MSDTLAVLHDISTRLGRLEEQGMNTAAARVVIAEKLDAVNQKVAAKLDDVNQKVADQLDGIHQKIAEISPVVRYVADHETRMRSLERERWLHRGGLAALAWVATKIGFTWHV